MHTEAQKQINKNWERKMSSIAMIFFTTIFCNTSDNLNIHADAIESENRVKSCYVCDGSAYRFRRLFFFSSLLNSICDEIGALAHSIWFIRAVWPKSVFNWFAPVDVINVVFPPRARDIAPRTTTTTKLLKCLWICARVAFASATAAAEFFFRLVKI